MLSSQRMDLRGTSLEAMTEKQVRKFSQQSKRQAVLGLWLLQDRKDSRFLKHFKVDLAGTSEFLSECGVSGFESLSG